MRIACSDAARKNFAWLGSNKAHDDFSFALESVASVTVQFPQSISSSSIPTLLTTIAEYEYGSIILILTLTHAIIDDSQQQQQHYKSPGTATG